MQNDKRSEREIDTATDVFMQLQYLGVESLTNLFYSVIAEIERKGGEIPPVSAQQFGRAMRSQFKGVHGDAK